MHKKHFFIVVLVFFAFFLFASSALLQDVFFRVTDALDVFTQIHPLLGALSFIGLAAASVLLGPFTSTPLVPSAVVIWGTERTFILLFLGWLLGNVASYTIGFYLGYPVVKKIAPKESLKHWIQTLTQKIDIPLALLFRLATPSETGYVFGTLKYNFFKYFFITFLAELPFVIITVYAGEAFVSAGWLAFLALGVIWLALISLAIWLLNKRLKN